LPTGPFHDEVAGGVAEECGVEVAPPIDSTGVGVGSGVAAAPSTTPVTLITTLVKSEAAGDGVGASARGIPGADRPESAAAPAPMRTTARPSARSRTENLRTGATPSESIQVG
jgi:hypothetical protein